MSPGSTIADRWLSTDLPVLERIAQLEEESQRFGLPEVMKSTGFDRPTVVSSLRRLDNEYVVFTSMNAHGGDMVRATDFRLLPAGRRAVGQWPAADAATALLEAIEARLESSDSEEERTLLERFLSAGKALTGKALQDLTIAFLKQQAGL